MSPNKAIENKITPHDKDLMSKHIGVQAKEKAFETAVAITQGQILALIESGRFINNKQASEAFEETLSVYTKLLETKINDNALLRLNATFEVPQAVK